MFKNLIKACTAQAVLLIIALVFLPMKAEASNFSHTHSSECYESVTMTCSNHRMSSYTVVDIKHCPVCLVQQPHTITGYFDVCGNGLVADRTCGYKMTCNVCGNPLKNDNCVLNPPHTYTGQRLKCGLEEGSNLGSIGLKSSTTDWTNKPVTIKAEVVGLSGGLSLDLAPYDFGSGFLASDSISVTENGTYSVTVRCNNGSTASASITVSNIDNTPPELSLSKSTDAWTESGLNVQASASDGESGINGECYSFDGGAYTSSSSVFVNSNRTVTVSVRDVAGNVTTKSITIANIGRDPAVIAKEKAEAEAKERAEAAAKEKAEAEAKAAAEQAKKAQAEAELKKQQSESKTSVSLTGKDNQSYSDKTSAADKKDVSKLQNDSKASDDKNGENTGEKGDDSNINKDNNEALQKDGVDVSHEKAGTLSGLFIVKDTTGKSDEMDVKHNSAGGSDSLENSSGLIGETVTDDAVYSPNENAEAGLVTKESQSVYNIILLVIGGIFLFTGIFMLLSLNYVYESKKGKIKLVSKVKVKRTNKRLIVCISEKKLKKGGRYMIYFSPVNSVLKRKKRVYVMTIENESLINTDEGIGFTY